VSLSVRQQERERRAAAEALTELDSNTGSQIASPPAINSTRKAPQVSIPVTGTVWLNGQSRPMATLVMPDGTKAILAIPHRNVSGDAESSQA
jgi:hypothetical protein